MVVASNAVVPKRTWVRVMAEYVLTYILGHEREVLARLVSQVERKWDNRLGAFEAPESLRQQPRFWRAPPWSPRRSGSVVRPCAATRPPTSWA